MNNKYGNKLSTEDRFGKIFIEAADDIWYGKKTFQEVIWEDLEIYSSERQDDQLPRPILGTRSACIGQHDAHHLKSIRFGYKDGDEIQLVNVLVFDRPEGDLDFLNRYSQITYRRVMSESPRVFVYRGDLGDGYEEIRNKSELFSYEWGGRIAAFLVSLVEYVIKNEESRRDNSRILGSEDQNEECA